MARSCVRCGHRLVTLFNGRRTPWRSSSRTDRPPLDAVMAPVRNGKLAMAFALSAAERRSCGGLRHVGTPGSAVAGACRCVAIPWGRCSHARYPVLLARRAARAFQEALKRHEPRWHQEFFAPTTAVAAV